MTPPQAISARLPQQCAHACQRAGILERLHQAPQLQYRGAVRRQQEWLTALEQIGSRGIVTGQQGCQPFQHLARLVGIRSRDIGGRRLGQLCQYRIEGLHVGVRHQAPGRALRRRAR